MLQAQADAMISLAAEYGITDVWITEMQRLNGASEVRLLLSVGRWSVCANIYLYSANSSTGSRLSSCPPIQRSRTMRTMRMLAR